MWIVPFLFACVIGGVIGVIVSTHSDEPICTYKVVAGDSVKFCTDSTGHTTVENTWP